MMFEESEGMDSTEDDVTAEADTQDNALMGSGEGYTLDADEFKKRIAERRNKLIEHNFIENPNSSDGNKKEYSIDDAYSVAEGKKRTPKADEKDSNPAPSPLNENY